ncbi:hypothetical protein [Nonomuraea fuscirosea]|uniref:hypothetical protein n=1 Tax=Nonomuraea fuscirosea TaxID=1291556 RepID=UPI0033E9BB62
MLRFLFDVPTTATVELSAESEHAASEIIDAYKGARFETHAIDGVTDDYRQIKLIELSSEGPATLVACWWQANTVPLPGDGGSQPSVRAVLPHTVQVGLAERLAAWDHAADGTSSDSEHATAAALAENVRTLLRQAKGGMR